MGSVDKVTGLENYGYEGIAHSNISENFALNSNISVTGASAVGYIVGNVVDTEMILANNYAFPIDEIDLTGSDRHDGTLINGIEPSDVATYMKTNSNWDWANTEEEYGCWTTNYTGYTTDANTNLPILNNISKLILQNPNIGGLAGSGTPLALPSPAFRMSR